MSVTTKRISILWLILLSTFAQAVPIDPHAEDRLQLQKILEESERGINTQELSLFTQHIDTQARVTFLNGEVAIGPEGVKNYFYRMVGDNPNAVLSEYKTRAKVIDKARFYGDVAVANGIMQDDFTPKARDVFKFDSVWTVTFAKQNDTWKIIALHFSTNAFNNSLTAELNALIKQYALIAFLCGLCLGTLVFLWRQKQKIKRASDISKA